MFPWFLGLNNFIISIVFMKSYSAIFNTNGAGQTVVYSKTSIIAEASINEI